MIPRPFPYLPCFILQKLCVSRQEYALTLELTLQQLASIAWLFYDAPMPPQGIFDDFLAMPSVQKNVSSRSFYDLVMSMNAANPASNVSIRLVIPVFDSDST
jgi:hypothetical protein